MGAPRNIPIYRVTAPPGQLGDNTPGRSFGWLVPSGDYRTRTKNNGADPSRGSYFNDGETWYGMMALRVVGTSHHPGRSLNWHDEAVSGFNWGSVSPIATDILGPDSTSFDTGNVAEDTIEYTSTCPGAGGVTHWNLPFVADEFIFLYYKILFKADCTGTFTRWRQRLSAPNLSAGPDINLTNIRTLNNAPGWFPGCQFWQGCYTSFTSGPNIVIDHLLSMWGRSWQQAWDDHPFLVEYQQNTFANLPSTYSANGSINTSQFPIPTQIAAQLSDPPGGGGGGGGGGGTPGAFPTTQIASTFDGADESPLSEGGNWGGPITAAGGLLRRVGNQAASVGGDGQGFLHIVATGGSLSGPDTEAYVEVPVLPANAQAVSVYGRLTFPGSDPRGQAYVLTYTVGVGFRFYKMTGGGTYTQIGATDLGHTLSAGEAFGLRIVGDGSNVPVTLQAFWRSVGGTWNALSTVTDTTSPITGTGLLGVEVTDSVARINNFGGGTVTTSGSSFTRGALDTGCTISDTVVAAKHTIGIISRSVTDTGASVADTLTSKLKAFRTASFSTTITDSLVKRSAPTARTLTDTGATISDGIAFASRTRVGVDSYADGASPTLGVLQSQSTLIYSLFGDAFVPYAPTTEADDAYYSSLPLLEAQTKLAETAAQPGTNDRVECGWHGLLLDSDRGSVALVRDGGPLADRVGDRVRVTGPDGSVVSVYVRAADALDAGIDISLPRRLFMELAIPGFDTIEVDVETLKEPVLA